MSQGSDRSAAVREWRQTIVDDALGRQRIRWPGMFERFSASQMANTVKDTGYHLDFLAATLWAGEQGLFDDYVGWTKTLFENLGLPLDWLTGSLADLRDAVGDALPPDPASAAVAVIDRSLAAFPTLGPPIPSFIDADRPLGDLATRYLVAVIGGQREAATREVLDAVEAGASVSDVYTYVLQPAQLELGRLWHHKAITVGQEHLATAITEATMARLYPHIFATPKIGRTLVATCVGDELHSMGIRMVADIFELGGWGTFYLGANTPQSSIVEALTVSKADVLALSVTMASHLETLADVISAVHADARVGAVHVIVGGYPFNTLKTLWKKVGADAYAPDARSAVEVAGRLVAS
jgi:methanogenic corrinoid protein MtbC1